MLASKQSSDGKPTSPPAKRWTAKDEKEYRDTSNIRAILVQWGEWKRVGDHLPLDSGSSLNLNVRSFNTLGYEEEVDEAVCKMLQPFRRVIRRQYLDERPHQSHSYYPRGRKREEKALSEQLSTSEYTDILRCGHHMLMHALQHLLKYMP